MGGATVAKWTFRRKEKALFQVAVRLDLFLVAAGGVMVSQVSRVFLFVRVLKIVPVWLGLNFNKGSQRMYTTKKICENLR